MRRLSHDDIEILFSVALAVADRLVLKRFRSKCRLERERGRQELAALLAARVDNDGSMVIVTEPVGDTYKTPGKWGVDEPDPTARSSAEG